MEFRPWMLWIAVVCVVLAMVLCAGKALGFFAGLPWALAILPFVPPVLLAGLIVWALLDWMANGAP